MNKGVIAIIVIVIVAVLGFVGYKATKKSNTTTPATTTTSSTSQSSTPSTSSTTTPDNSTTSQTATITYDGNGFSPATLTVKSGTTVTLKNTSSKEVQFDSDPHPVHTDDPELNLGPVAPGQSGTFLVKTTGTHGYHNHLDPSQTGTIVVQ